MSGTCIIFIVALLLQVVILQTGANSNGEILGRYLKREERGTPSKLRFTSGSYGFYNATSKESAAAAVSSTIRCDMKMGMYIYDERTQIVFKVDDTKRFSVRSQKVEDFVFLHLAPNTVLNSDIQSVYTINVVAIDNRTSEEIDKTKIYLHLLDVNEFKPSFSNKSIDVSVRENFELGQPILKVHAVDADSGLNGALYYFISPSDVSSAGEFSLHPHTGALSLVKPLDFNRRKSYAFNILAKDKCPSENQRLQSEPLSVRISVISVPKLPTSGRIRGKRQDALDPSRAKSLPFSQSIYTVSVSEISPPFTPIIRVGLNKSYIHKIPNVNFGFFKGNEAGRFDINIKTGQIYLVRELDYEETTYYNLTVIAYHRSLIRGKTSVIIRVLDSNDHSPTFPKLLDEVTVDEETPIGTVVYRAKASDLDTGVNKQMHYSICNVNETYFAIDSSTGFVRVAKRIDRDGEKSVSSVMYLLIRASDFGVPVKREGRMILKIKIKQINDNPPVLEYTNCSITVARNARKGTRVMRVNAIDLDEPSHVAFEMAGDILKIGRRSGYVTLNSIPENSKESNNLVVRLVGRPLGKTLKLTVVIAPEVNGKQINFTCLKNPEFTRVQDIIRRRRNREKTQSTETFSPVVVPQKSSHKPVILEKPDAVMRLREDLPVGTVVSRVVGVDRELSCYGLVLYSIISGSNNVDSNFAIDMLNGSIYLAAKLDREQNPVYNLKIGVWDAGTPPQHTDVAMQIQVVDVNDNGPAFTKKKYEVTVPENTHPGTVILPVHAEDPDSGTNGIVIYSLVNNFHNLFSINKYSGHLKLEKMLDYEKAKEYVLIVQAVDSSSQVQQISQASVVITVDDLNDTPPECMPRSQTFEVTKNFPPGAVLGKVLAYDPDTGDGGKLNFRIGGSQAQRYFSLDSEYGILRINAITMSWLKKNLMYNLTVIVSDKGVPSLSTSCSIVCIMKPSLTSERPKFSLKGDDSLVVADIVPGDIMVVDATLEGSGEMEYSLVDGTGIGDFTIDSKSGVIRKAGDSEQQSSISHYWLTVNAHLKKHPEVYSNIPVLLRKKVTKVALPYFDPTAYRVSVKENLPALTDVIQLSVVNGNSGPGASHLAFKIVDGNSQGHFEVTKQGKIRTTKSLDREKISTYHLNISVSMPHVSKRVAFASVRILVEDVNDHDPQLVASSDLIFYVLEQNAVTSGNGTYLAQVMAIDKDEGINAELVYQMEHPNSNIMIDRKTGVLSSKAALAEGEYFVIGVKVCDKGGRCIHQYGGIVVVAKPKHHLRMLKFKKPEFVFKHNEGTKGIKPFLQEERESINLLRLLTSGKKPGEHLQFSIESGNEDGIFGLSPLPNANLIQLSELDYETKREHILVIKVTNGQSSDSTTIKIIVNNLNDNVPTTSQSCYETEVMENVASGRKIFQIEALDPDSVSKGTTVFKLVDIYPHGTNRSFSVSADGKIKTSMKLDREEQNRYVLTLFAEDHSSRGQIQRTTFCVVVHVKDANDHKPRFTKPLYVTRVSGPLQADTPLLRLLAVDHDIGTNALLRFFITGGNDVGYFKIDSSTGIISSGKRYSSKEKKTFSLNVEVADSGTLHVFKDRSVVKITVYPAKPRPGFSNRTYTIVVPENQLARPVLSVSIPNLQLNYRILADNKSSLRDCADDFRIDHLTGIISAKVPFDAEKFTKCAFSVYATDGVDFSDYTSVIVNIKDENDNAPKFQAASYYGIIDEGSKRGSEILSTDSPDQQPLVVKASDADAGENSRISYSILEASAKRNFEVDTHTGKLVTRQVLDREKKSKFEFHVLARDNGSPSLFAFAKVIVTVNDINDRMPEFTQQIYRVQLYTPIFNNTRVATVHANDGDSNVFSSVHYTLLNHKEIFRISPTSGTIWTKNVALLTSSVYSLAVAASDNIFTSSCQVVVSLTPIRAGKFKFRKPVAQTSVLENNPNSERLIVLNAVGYEIGDRIEYSIVNPMSSFFIDPNIGAIYTRNGSSFDREKRSYYMLIVQGKMARDPSKVAQGVVNVTITDVNDNRPVFVGEPYYQSVHIDMPAKAKVLQVKARDGDIGSNAEIRYKITSGSLGKFEIDEHTGIITIKEKFVKGKTPSKFNLEVTAKDMGSPELKSVTRIEIPVVNEDMPVFDKNYLFDVFEDASLSTIIGKIVAKGPDGRHVYYSISSGDEYDQFSLDFNTGELSTLDTLDQSVQDVYNLTVQATDSRSGSWSTTGCTIKVIDVNDHRPVFEKPLYTAKIRENVAIGTFVSTVKASDKDRGRNAEVNYSFDASEKEKLPFVIDRVRGVVRVQNTLDYESRKSYIIRVHAVDKGEPSLRSSTFLHIQIRDVNDNPPAFEQARYNFVVGDFIMAGQFVGKVTCFDKDSGINSNLRYMIPDSTLASVSNDTGMLTLNREPKRGSDALFQIKCTDGKFTSSAIVNLKPEEVNKYSPTFQSPSLEIRVQDNHAPAFLTVITATDLDYGSYGTIMYSIDSSSLKEKFHVNPTTGDIFTKVALDRESENHGKVVVPIRASDIGGKFDICKLSVIIVDINDNDPVFEFPSYEATVSSATRIDSTILRVKALDRDSGKNGDITYVISGLDTGAPFKINKKTGVIELNGRVEGSAYQFVVKALDNGYPARESSAMVRINVVSSTQPILMFGASSYVARVSESAETGKLVSVVKLESPDESITYEFVKGNLPSSNPTGVFSIDPKSGSVHLSGKLDYETTSEYSLMVKAHHSDQSMKAVYAHLQVKIENVNDNPPVFDSKAYNITISENIPINSEILQVIAFDADYPQGSQLRYVAVKHSPTEGKSLFSLDEKTGVLKVVSALNAERQSSHEITVRVYDNERSGTRRFSDTAIVKITVLDVNDSPPVFVASPRMVTAREDHVVGEKIATVLAQDADTNPTIRYYIEKGNELGIFRMDERSGEIKLSAPLDRESYSSSLVKVIAYDGVFVAKMDITIVVTDINDNSPVCTNAFYHLSIVEGEKRSPVVAQVGATDSDSSDELTYTLQGDGFSKFLVNDRTGELMPQPGIDREKHSTFGFKVFVTDKGGHSCYSDVYVDIIDKNDNRPVFLQTNYVVPVRENASISSMVTRVQATDKDKGPNRKVSYRLTNSNTFSVQLRTGIITLERALNKKVKSSYSLTVEAYDDGNPALSSSVSVNITVLGASEQPPEFTKQLFVFSVKEDLPVNGLVGVVKTVRKRGSEKGSVEYELVAGNRAIFTVEKQTGRILLRKQLDYESTKTISLSVKAVYTHVASLSSVVPVTVHVQDVNDNQPVFSQRLYTASVDENVRADSYVTRVLAEDRDTGLNGRVAYKLVESEQVPFRINKQTGAITVTGSSPIDREQRSSYIFKVKAYDAGSPSLFSEATVNVTIADLNDNPPEIEKPNSTILVQPPKKGDVLFSWISKDRDSRKNGPPFTYTLIKGDKSKFSVVDESDVKGSLIADGKLGVGSRHDLVVRVTDNGSPPQSSLCHLTLLVVKESRTKPIITEPTMFFTVIRKPSESVKIGDIKIDDKDRLNLYHFKITDGNDDKTFSIETFSGFITGRPKPGIYTIGVEVSNGKYTSATVITIIVNSITEDVYQNSVVLTAFGISADNFVRDKMKSLANFIRSLFSVKIENVVIWAVQTKDSKRKTREVGSRSDTEVAFAVKRANNRGFIEPATLQSSLKAAKESLERELRISIWVAVTNPCVAAPCAIDKKCAAVVKPLPHKTASNSDTLYTMFSRSFACLCLDGSKGPDCTGITACSSNPCKKNEKCTPIGSSYECEKDINGGAIQLDGKDYVSYVLRESFDSVFRSLEVSFRTEANNGYLFYAKDHDYCILEIKEGKIRFKFDFGTGQGDVKIDDIQVNDGKWHKVEVIRDANHATLRLDDGKFKSDGSAKGDNVKIDLNSNTVYFGAGIITEGAIENGFRGCLRHAKFNGQLLPWNGNNSVIASGRSYGVKRSCKDSGACKETKCPLFSDCINTLSSYRCQCMPGHIGTFCKATVTCADNPCQNGGTCTYFRENGVIEYRCKCRLPYTGAQCQTNSGLCASNPCKNGGKCENTKDGMDYQCKCPARYHGPNCELDSDSCASSPCFFGAKCTRVQYGFKCDCPPDKKGKRCGYGYYCENHRCGVGGKCIETLDGPVCKCSKGYKGTHCQFDVNECLLKSTKCPSYANCINTVGSYFCNCTHPKGCEPNDDGKPGAGSFNLTNLVYYIAVPLLVIVLVVLACLYIKKCRSRQEYDNSRATLDYKHPQVDCVPLGTFAPHVPPRFDDVPPDYYTDGSCDIATAALYDPSQDAFSPQSTVSGDSFKKAPQSSVELPRKLQMHTFGGSPSLGGHRGGADVANGKGSVSDVSESGDHLHGPYHWDYSEVPEDVVNRSKPTRSGSKEGSRMGLSYNYGYEETPRVHDKLTDKVNDRRDSVNPNPEEGENPGVPKRPVNFRLSWQSLAKTEMESPKAARGKMRAEADASKTGRSPPFQRAAASRGSENSLLEPYESINTRLSAKDFNNRYSLAIEDDTSLYLQDYLGGECPAPPSETCPSDIDTCTRPSMSMAFSDTDEVPFMQQRRMLPSEISCLDNMTETSYNSDDEYNEDYNERDPLDPDDTRKLERDIKILIKDLNSKTEAEYQ